MTYQEAVSYLLDIPKFASKTNHDNLRGYLARLGNPHMAVPCIHVAGTNGKGSTCAFLESILHEAGYKVGIFTSPHLVKVNERFRIHQDAISDQEFLEVFLRVQEVVNQGLQDGLIHPNFFEFLFLMASLWYQEKQVDYVIYETGLGGRLDATNVVKPVLSIITSIGMDHMQYLGDTLEKIAGEKAGIVKAGVPCVYIKQDCVSDDVIEQAIRACETVGMPVEKGNIILHNIHEDTIDFSYLNQYDKDNVGFCMKKTALYQLENASLAIEAAYYMLTHGVEGLQGKQVFTAKQASKLICAGIQVASWRGRMEQIEPDVYIDGAHNEPAIRAFCQTISNVYGDKKKILLFAVASDKQYNEMIGLLCEATDYDRIIVTAIDGYRNTPVSEVAALFRDCGACEVEECADCRQAYALARQYKTEQHRVFCVGSLYLVGSILEYIQS